MQHLKTIVTVSLVWSALSCNREVPKMVSVNPQDKPSPIYEQEQKSEIDVRLLRITPYFDRFINGYITYTSALTPESWLARSINKPDLGEILNAGDDVHLIALGGGLTAGAQNGGLYRQGQLTAYPNLVAHQLGMANFTTPAFDKQHENGTGFDIRSEGATFSLLRVNNDLGTIKEEVDGYPPIFQPYKGIVHNFASPWMSPDNTQLNWEPSFIGKISSGNGVSWPMALPYLRRFIHEDEFKKGTLYDYVQRNQEYNFFILEDRNEIFLNAIRRQGSRKIDMNDLIGDIQSGSDNTEFALKKLTFKGQKGVIFTVPYYKDLGVGSWTTPTLSTDEIKIYDSAVTYINRKVQEWAKNYNLVIVDLNAIYEKIHNGSYKTEQGLKINGGLDGNFFSSDGIYPGILGQVILANETCQAINKKYHAKISFIDIKEYLKSIDYSHN